MNQNQKEVFAAYQKMYDASISDSEGFWEEIASNFFWETPWDSFCEYSFKPPVSVEFFKGGKTNLSYNALDRHLGERGDQKAILWEGNEPGEATSLTYRELHEKVCRFANVLKEKNVKKGDRVSIYMPMIPELAIAMLACARIGAIHSIVFGGFSAEALATRIEDSGCRVLITADGVMRGAKLIPLKEIADEAMKRVEERSEAVQTCIVARRLGGDVCGIEMQEGRDFDFNTLLNTADKDCPPEWMDAEGPLFILYTSGSTGKPKGVLHTTGGYMVYAATTFKHVFDHQSKDVYWCTADIGWVTGHSYVVYGPLCNGATTLMFEGVPTYPDGGRFWDVVEKYRVNKFYTAPTAIRALMQLGDEPPRSRDLSSLEVLGTVGEPINPEAWNWYHEVIGEKRCPIVDTWWQTETGGIMISPIPGVTPLKPGSATLPFFGVDPVIVDEKGTVLEGECEGNLCLRSPWPGMMRTVYGHHERFEETYFSMYPGMYFTGDGCRRDQDGYYWITGRVDDVINVSGHRMGTAEVESALVEHPSVCEAAVVGFPHEVKGQGIYAYVTLMNGQSYEESLKVELKKFVREHIGAIAAPDVIHWAPALPKTRSGKIMRRILRKIAAGEEKEIGDVSTLADSGVVQALLENRR